jgi:hypothetical protein
MMSVLRHLKARCYLRRFRIRFIRTDSGMVIRQYIARLGQRKPRLRHRKTLLDTAFYHQMYAVPLMSTTALPRPLAEHSLTDDPDVVFLPIPTRRSWI